MYMCTHQVAPHRWTLRLIRMHTAELLHQKHQRKKTQGKIHPKLIKCSH